MYVYMIISWILFFFSVEPHEPPFKGIYKVWKGPIRQWGFIVSKQEVIDEGLEHGSMNVRSAIFR